MTPANSSAAVAVPPSPGPGSPPAPLPGAPPAARAPARRRWLFPAVAVLLAAVAAGFGLRAYLARFDQGTDDARVEASVVPVAPTVGGRIVHVLVQDNQVVKKGELLVAIDDADFAARAAQAEADLATARAQAAAADAQVAAAAAAASKADVEAGKAVLDLRRAEKLKVGGSISEQVLDDTRAASGTSRAGAATAAAQVTAARAQARLAHARVKSAEAVVELARLKLSYTRIASPADGQISKLDVHEGQLVAAGQPLGELVPLQTYVVANFKETQLGRMRPGQKADVEIDAYAGRTFPGVVESISGGTGARFALIPADNASGNFVKVVERVPVRIAWAKPPPPDVALRAGLSAYVTVHTR